MQGVADFRYFTFYPPDMKSRHARKSAPRTIMNKSEKKKPAFLKPRRKMFKRSEYKRALKAKVFGLTTSTGLQLICHVKARFTSHDWVKLVRQRVGPFLKRAFAAKKDMHHLAGWQNASSHRRGRTHYEVLRLACLFQLANALTRLESSGERVGVDRAASPEGRVQESQFREVQEASRHSV